VVGAVFGQTEGLLGEDLDLRELQRTGRIGRIQIVIKSEGGMSTGEIVIPVSLDKTATAILAASLETVDRVGPCIAKITIEKLEDIRGAKRRRVVSRAISILKGWEEEIAPGSEEITSAVSVGSRKQIAKFGPDKLPSGPGLTTSDEIIIVEGRADVVNLMKSGIENTVAVEGTHVPKSISDLTRRRGKTVIAFLDGDRGGDLILRELMQVAKVDYIARAPEGREVEELPRREVMKALQAKIPADQALSIVSAKSRTSSTHQQRQSKRPTRGKRDEYQRSEPQGQTKIRRTPPSTISIGEEYVSKVAEVRESFQAVIFDEAKQVVQQCGVAELAKTMEEMETVHAVVFDGVITQRLVDIAGKKRTHLIIGAAVADIENKPPTMLIRTFDDVTS
jgi:DNA primase